jgi:DNA-binding transcriptional MerR regulator
MEIRELAARVGLSTKTIRYYEQVGVLPSPKRRTNGYRIYDENDVDRLKFVIGARQLDFTLEDITEILALRDCREAPCKVVLDLLMDKAHEVSLRIEALQKLETSLRELHELGKTFPMDDIEGKNCVCHLVSSQGSRIVSGPNGLD